jgi:hypothetical protein
MYILTPCDEKLNVDVSIKSSGFYIVSIYNVYSQRVMSHKKFFNSGFQKEVIDTKMLNSGFYTIEVCNGIGKTYSKFVIMK